MRRWTARSNAGIHGGIQEQEQKQGIPHCVLSVRERGRTGRSSFRLVDNLCDSN